MKNRKNFKKKNINYRKDQDEIRIKERRKQPKKISKQHLYNLMEEDDAVDDSLYDNEEEWLFKK